jgi:hypothetical protein
MPSLLDDPEAYAFAAQIAEDERKKRGLQSLLGGIGGLLEAPVNYVKERATALATDPIGDMKRTMQGTIDRAKQREQLQQIAYGDPQNPTRVTDQAAADQLAQDYLDMASTIMPAGMTVFHGSPYKFNAFAPKAIGSGEGAQAYGYGHYVAESPEIAKSYATNLSNRDIANQGRLNAHANAKRLAELAGDAQYAADDIRFVLENNPFHEQKNLLTETLDLLESGNYAKPLASQGNFYKIDLPDEQIDKMLDWDAEISKQTSEIQKLAKQYGLNMDDLGGDLVAAMNAKLPEGAEAMRQAGVPGIKYFDAQSRGGQKADTRNFVVFPKNEGLLKIEEVNGQPVQGGLLSAVPTSDVADTLIYHGTTPSAAKAIEKSGFDVSKSADGTIWFTSNPNIGEVAASGKGAVVNRKLNESNLKLAGWDEIDKYSVDELVNMGYDGVKMPDGNQTTYQIFNPEKLKK